MLRAHGGKFLGLPAAQRGDRPGGGGGGADSGEGGAEGGVDVDVEDWSKWLSEEFKDKEKVWRDAQRAARDARDQKDESEKKPDFGKDFGPDGALYRLSRTCYELRTEGFDYKVCPFSEAKQDHVRLGNWGKWAPMADADYERQSSSGGGGGNNKRRVSNPAVPGKMVLDDGEKCWNGPRRQMEVTFWCGAEDKLLTVREPDMCRYVAEMETPAACYDEQAKNDSTGDPLA